MLDAISDFWKPMKKTQAQEKLQPEQLQVGSTIGFGFVPQSFLSGRRLQIAAINTYQFGDEKLTSFVLSQEKEANPASGVSMIVAESDGEQYLAISRRMSISDRMKMFDSKDLEAVTEKADATTLPCKDGGADYKGWTVASYKREMQGVKGLLYKGDFRKQSTTASSAQEFKYTLLVSDSNEHAIEIEQYGDGRVEVYATIYRRMSDVGEIIYASNNQAAKTEPRPDIKLASSTMAEAPRQAASATAEPKLTADPKAEAPKQAEKPAVTTTAKSEPIKLQELSKPASPAAPETKSSPELVKSAPVMQAKPATPPTTATPIKENPKEEKRMPEAAAANGAARVEPKSPPLASNNNIENKPASVIVQPTAPANYLKQEVKTVSKNINGLDGEAIECDLRIANKIIDEAIRNEMRLSDVVRRIIELPVAYPEAVQIPITLTDEDYALLAIRYGIASSDRNAIKRRIIEDLNDFSGAQKKAAA